jgi:hypothetical protein
VAAFSLNDDRGELTQDLIALALGVIIVIYAAVSYVNRPDSLRQGTNTVNGMVAKARSDAREFSGASIFVDYNAANNTTTLTETSGNMASTNATLGNVLEQQTVNGQLGIQAQTTTKFGVFFDNTGTLAASTTWDGQGTPSGPVCAANVTLTLTEPNVTGNIVLPCE